MKNWSFIIWMIFIVIILFFVGEFFKPIVNNSRETKTKIDSLNNLIILIQKNQLKLDSTISSFSNGINKVDSNIKNIKGQKTIIKEIYHEKINSVINYDTRQIDSFFSNRYGG